MAPFRRALKGVVDGGDVENLIEAIPGTGLRLNVPPGECLVVEKNK
jgi:hypothetical protein